MTCRVSLWVCLFVYYDAVKKSWQQRRQTGGGVDVWLSVNTVAVVVVVVVVIIIVVIVVIVIVIIITRKPSCR